MKTASLKFTPPLYPKELSAPSPESTPPTDPVVLARVLSKPLPPIVVAKALSLDKGSAAP
jgi:hypothetical protein